MILIGLRNCSEDLINKNLFKFKKTHPCVLWDMIKAACGEVYVGSLLTKTSLGPTFIIKSSLRWKTWGKFVPARQKKGNWKDFEEMELDACPASYLSISLNDSVSWTMTREPNPTSQVVFLYFGSFPICLGILVSSSNHSKTIREETWQRRTSHFFIRHRNVQQIKHSHLLTLLSFWNEHLFAHFEKSQSRSQSVMGTMCC